MRMEGITKVLTNDLCKVSILDYSSLFLICCHCHSTAFSLFYGNWSNCKQGPEIIGSIEINSVVLRFLNKTFPLVLVGLKYKFR